MQTTSAAGVACRTEPVRKNPADCRNAAQAKICTGKTCAFIPASWLHRRSAVAHPKQDQKGALGHCDPRRYSRERTVQDLNARPYLLKEHLLPIPPRPATCVKYFTIPLSRLERQPNAKRQFPVPLVTKQAGGGNAERRRDHQ